MRKAFVTAAIEWTAKLSDETEPRFYSNQFQSDRLLFASLGDSTGQQIPGADRSGEPFAFSAHQVLCEGGQRWSYTEEATTAE
ncbi:MAG: hypothetical protein BroJett003_20310 [Planctomycetota bacterium]|nr:MAG: hypothetical protein BroJett003_20310 [Planctomycetota bacterium]